MSEDLLMNDKIWAAFLLATSFTAEWDNSSNRDYSKMKNKSVKKSIEKAKNVLEEKRKMYKQKIA